MVPLRHRGDPEAESGAGVATVRAGSAGEICKHGQERGLEDTREASASALEGQVGGLGQLGARRQLSAGCADRQLAGAAHGIGLGGGRRWLWKATANGPKMDAKNAYLQGDAITRELYLRPPAGGIPGVDLKPGSLMKVPIYGTGDAARGWCKKISQSLKDSKWRASALEPALLYLWDCAELVGMCTTHVDDLLRAGEGKVYEESMAMLKKLVDFDQNETLQFQHCGKLVKQLSDGTIEVRQEECAR
jgi:hypothetical protein